MIFIILIIISIFAVFLFNYNSVSTVDTNTNILKNKESSLTQDTKIKKQETAEHSNIIKKEITIDKPQEEVIITKEEKLKLFPSLDFIRKIQSSTLNYYEDNTNIQKSVTKKEISIEKKKTIISEASEEKKVVEKPILPIETKNIINIKRKNSNDDIGHVITRFKVNNNPALSLFIAKKYYQLKEYENAYNYALITNEINNNIEASWIIFAKSLVKLKKKDMAIKTLKRYINYSHSSQAKLLLNEILTGKFK
ncbi:MAG: CDC27 family protein [Sulfurimonas sp.]|nr:CDC27 family protein [Sulfurimonas sp.]